MFYIPKSPFQAIKSSFQAIYPDSPLNHDHNLQKINKNFIIFLKNKTPIQEQVKMLNGFKKDLVLV